MEFPARRRAIGGGSAAILRTILAEAPMRFPVEASGRRRTMPPSHIARRLPPVLPCLLLAWAVAAPARGQAVGADADRLESQSTLCISLAQNSPHEALPLADRILAQPALPPMVEIAAVNCRALALHTLGQGERSQQAVARLRTLLQAPGLSQDRQYKKSRRWLALLLQRNGRIEEALRIFESILERDVAEGDIDGQITTLSNLAQIHGEQMEDLEGTLRYRQQALALAEHLQRPPARRDATLHYNYGYALLRLRRYDEAGKAFDRAEAIVRQFSTQETLLYLIRSHRAEMLRVDGQLDAARTELLAILPWQRQNDLWGYATSLQRLARIALDRNAAEEARDLGEQALAVGERGRFPPSVRDSLDLLAEISVALGDTAEARDYLRRAQQSSPVRLPGDSLDRLARLQARAAQALDPARVNALQEAKRDRLLRNAALAVVAALLLGGTGLYLRMRRQQRRLRRLAAADAATGRLEDPGHLP